MVQVWVNKFASQVPDTMPPVPDMPPVDAIEKEAVWLGHLKDETA